MSEAINREINLGWVETEHKGEIVFNPVLNYVIHMGEDKKNFPFVCEVGTTDKKILQSLIDDLTEVLSGKAVETEKVNEDAN